MPLLQQQKLFGCEAGCLECFSWDATFWRERQLLLHPVTPWLSTGAAGSMRTTETDNTIPFAGKAAPAAARQPCTRNHWSIHKIYWDEDVT